MTTELSDDRANALAHDLDHFVNYLVAERDASPYTVKNYAVFSSSPGGRA
jgi:hypothetical protein